MQSIFTILYLENRVRCYLKEKLKFCMYRFIIAIRFLPQSAGQAHQSTLGPGLPQYSTHVTYTRSLRQAPAYTLLLGVSLCSFSFQQ